MTPGCSVLVIDDEDSFRERLLGSLKRKGFITYGAATPQQALDIFGRHLPSSVILDLRLGPSSNGLQLLEELMKINAEAKIAVLTGFGSIASAVEAIRLGAITYLTKPCGVAEILRAFKGIELTNTNEELQTASLARAEWEYIQRVLNDCQGNITHASEILRIPRRTLQRKLQKYPPKQ